MKYSETETIRILEKSELSVEERVIANIFNFIRVIHLNQLDFITTSFDTEYFGDLPMTFKKKSGQVIGMITANINNDVRKYVFTETGYEMLDEISSL